MASRRLWQCKAKHPKRQFSVKVGTIFEDSAAPLDKWLAVIWLVANAKNGISSYEVHRAVGVTQKTAWFMLSRIRLAMQTGSFDKLSGHVEVDETFIGGKARNMNAKTRKGTLQGEVRQHVESGSEIYTDALRSYDGLRSGYIHKVVDHAEKYVDGVVHTNGLENFWSLLKRSITGTYVSVEPFHLFRYLDEQAFRFNNRQMTDGGRFPAVAASVVGKRLTYRELIGKGPTPSPAVAGAST
jgi:transposase-like protein